MKQHFPIKMLCLFGFCFLAFPGAAQELEDKAEGEPLSITIRPDYDIFDGEFEDGSAKNAPRIKDMAGCPAEQILSCDVTARFGEKGNQISDTIALFAYEKEQKNWRQPALGMLLGKTYAGLPDYIIMASFGVYPGLEPLDPYPQPTGEMYGSLWFADTFNLGDRMAGPVMLAKTSKGQIERLNRKRGICIGVC